MVDLNAHEAGNGGKSQGKPTAHSVLLYSEREGPPLTVACEVSICWPGLHPPAKSVFEREKNTVFRQRTRGRHFRHWPVYIHISGTSRQRHRKQELSTSMWCRTIVKGQRHEAVEAMAVRCACCDCSRNDGIVFQRSLRSLRRTFTPSFRSR